VEKEQIEAFIPDVRWTDARVEFKDYYAKDHILLLDACAAFQNLIRLLISNAVNPPPKVSGRVKEVDESIKKFELKYLKECESSPEAYQIRPKITDLIGLRVVCIYESDIERVAEILRKNLQVLQETDKTEALEIHENQFGYKGLHIDAKLDGGRAALPEYSRFSGFVFEVQIRSIVQDAWSEVDHRLKYKKRIPKELKRRINRLAAIFELADQEFETIRLNTTGLEEEGRKDTKTAEGITPLTPFNFGPTVEKFFPDEPFEPFKVDGFVDELLQQNENLTMKDLAEILSECLPKVQKYRDYLSRPELGHKMNAFTQIRHALYLKDKILYLSLMRSGPLKNFDRWLAHGTVYPGEVEWQKKLLLGASDKKMGVK
jgi:ppGpp synthetase/RelA/SpoT-type nucleotidyltranferase